MSEVVIVGGGLTGLAAAFELDRLNIPYTLIEVRPRLGGSVLTRRESGFVLDGSAFVLEKYGAWSWLDDLGMSDALVKIGRYRDGDLVIFRDGTESLVDALRSRLRGTILTRMAVSSLGELDTAQGKRGGVGVCLENGVLIEARAAIVTAPARYAAHMLWSLTPDAALLLENYPYEPVVRISLGYRRADLEGLAMPEPPKGFKFLEAYTMPERIPADHVLVRAGVRLENGITTADQALDAARGLIPASPVVAWAHYWSEADSLTRHLPEHAETMAALEAALPPNVVIAGSDYRAKRLDQQVEQGREAARKVRKGLSAED